MPVIEFQRVSKRYDVGVGRRNLGDALSSLISQRFGSRVPPSAGANEFWALRDVTFRVQAGEILGLVGANGAGKSTILKLLSKVTYPTRGQITVDGRVSALIELGAGFHPDLTGRENAYLSGSILGLSRREIDERLASMIDFAELGEFIDTPVKRYSSGMYVRLGFAVAVHVDPQILLIDEVLAVGDVMFRDKCVKKVDDFRRQGKTMVIVSHDRHMLERLCDRAVLLYRGELVDEGPVAKVMDTYYRSRIEHVDLRLDEQTRALGNNGHHSQPLEITKVSVGDEAGNERERFLSGEPMVARIAFRANTLATDPVFYCDLCYEEQLLNGNNTSRFDIVTGTFRPGDTGVVEVRYEQLNLLEGQYYLRVGITQDIFTQIKYHVVDKAVLFEVSSGIGQGAGLVRVPQRWEIHATPADAVSPSVDAAATEPDVQ
jgi:ABC-type polysaccharide/polyol phosphate transport system ATPase subunit